MKWMKIMQLSIIIFFDNRWYQFDLQVAREHIQVCDCYSYGHLFYVMF